MHVASRFRKDAQVSHSRPGSGPEVALHGRELFQQLQNEMQVTNVFNSPDVRQRNRRELTALINGQKISIQQLAGRVHRKAIW